MRDWTMIPDRQDDIDYLASLGQPIGEFNVSGYVLLRRLGLAFLLVIGGVGLDVILLVAAKIHHFHILVWGLLLTLMGLTMAVRTYRNSGLRVIIYPEGGILFRGDKVVTFFWDEITQVWRQKSEEHWSKAWQGNLVLLIEKNNGEKIWLDDGLPGLLELATLIDEMTVWHLLTTSLATLREGAAIEFGDLTVEPLGLRVKNESLPWEEVGEIKSDDGSLTIFPKGKQKKWRTLKAAAIPNYHIVPLLVLKVKEELLAAVSRDMKKGVPSAKEGTPV